MRPGKSPLPKGMAESSRPGDGLQRTSVRPVFNYGCSSAITAGRDTRSQQRDCPRESASRDCPFLGGLKRNPRFFLRRAAKPGQTRLPRGLVRLGQSRFCSLLRMPARTFGGNSRTTPLIIGLIERKERRELQNPLRSLQSLRPCIPISPFPYSNRNPSCRQDGADTARRTHARNLLLKKTPGRVPLPKGMAESSRPGDGLQRTSVRPVFNY